MKTPIFDFVTAYASSDAKRLHMPGHKGVSLLGCEKYDITEISGADALYEADGIIAESEKNASALFGCDTFYSTEGSSQCIRAMLFLAVKHAKSNGKRPLILAARNAHKVFLSAAALIDFDIEWLYGGDSYLSCDITADEVEAAVKKYAPTAVYLTSPDYLGNIQDISGISKVCKRYGVLLLADNAHGAYLKFLDKSLHPCDMGADMCCDSAHKTLPSLTGGAYLHIKDKGIAKDAKSALALFGSTSPSYLILQSLDLVNNYIDSGYKTALNNYIKEVNELKSVLAANGYTLVGDEPLKVTVSAKPYGYYGTELSKILESQGFVCEFGDRDFTVMMFTPESGSLKSLTNTLLGIEKHTPITEAAPKLCVCERIMSVRDAIFAECEALPVENCDGRVLAEAEVGCPPAVPIVMCGEKINSDAIKSFKYYSIEKCNVVKD